MDSFLGVTGSAGLLTSAIIRTRATIVLAWRLGVSANVNEGGLVAVGLGDTSDLAPIAGRDSLDVDLAGAFLALGAISMLDG